LTKKKKSRADEREEGLGGKMPSKAGPKGGSVSARSEVRIEGVAKKYKSRLWMRREARKRNTSWGKS